jgi:hypothetical protein
MSTDARRMTSRMRSSTPSRTRYPLATIAACRFRSEGDTPSARKALDAALAANARPQVSLGPRVAACRAAAAFRAWEQRGGGLRRGIARRRVRRDSRREALAAHARRESPARVADDQAADAPIRTSVLTEHQGRRGEIPTWAALDPACQFGFSSAVDVSSHPLCDCEGADSPGANYSVFPDGSFMMLKPAARTNY